MGDVSTQGDLYEANVQAIVEQLQPKGVGQRPKTFNTKRLLGLEVEHFILNKQTGEPLPYKALGQPSAQDLLNYLLQFYPEPLYFLSGEIKGCAGDRGNVTLEGGAQIEISLPPYEKVSEIDKAYSFFLDALTSYLESREVEIADGAYHPTRRADDIEVIPDARYGFFIRYFRELGRENAERTMRASTATQISIDYRDEADAIRKFLIGTALAPILSAICDNVHVYEGVPNHHFERRLITWHNQEPTRSGAIPGTFDPDFGFDSYARWLMEVTPIYLQATDSSGNYALYWVDGKPAKELFAHTPMDEEEIAHLMGLVWPDVRLKGTLELRMADMMPKPQVLGYVALIKGLFYSDRSLETLEDLLKDQVKSNADVDAAIEELFQRGFDSVIYGRSLKEWIAVLFDLASQGLGADEAAYLGPLLEFALTKPWIHSPSDCRDRTELA